MDNTPVKKAPLNSSVQFQQLPREHPRRNNKLIPGNLGPATILSKQRVAKECVDPQAVKTSSEDCHTWPLLAGGGNGRLGFLDKDGDWCDVFDGNWVWDDNHPLNRSQDCSFIDYGFGCIKNGRPDGLYTKLRWQPKNCNLPRFDARLMLEMLRNRRLVFVGDSIGRNQGESMLAAAVPGNSSIYEVNGSLITKHKGFLAFMFEDDNCTVEYYRAPFLMVLGRTPAGAPNKVRMTVRVDTLDWTSPKWKDADVLIINSGHWWNDGKTIRGGWR